MASRTSSPAEALEQATSELIIASRGNDSEEKVSKIIKLLTITKEIKGSGNDNIVISSELLKCLRLMLVDQDKSIRVQSCRAMRYITCNLQTLNLMISLNIPIFMMICLEREDNKYLWERMQSLKWIRHLMDNYPKHIPKCCIMSLIGIAQNGKDEFRRICLDSLRELCITNTYIINKCNGFKVLIDSILNPQLNDISNSLVLTILYILDHPNTRKYLRPSLDIQRLLAPFVDINPYKKDALTKQEKEQKEKTREIAQKTLMTMLKSITGIFYLGGDHSIDLDDVNGTDPFLSKYKNKSCLKILVDLMKLPNKIEGIQWSRKIVFDVLENALLPLSDTNKLDGQRGPNLIVNYVCLILMAFIKNGLIECLVDVGMRSDLDLAPRARTLLQRIQFLSAKYLPPSLCSRITNIEKVINDATMFNNKDFVINNKNHCHCDCHLKNKKKYKSNLQITVQRNFANMMISELTEGASLDHMDNNDDNKHNQIGVDNEDNSHHQHNHHNKHHNHHHSHHSHSHSHSHHNNNNNDNIYVSSQIICHRLGPEFDLNSTFIRYRYMMERDIPSLMFQDRIPYHHHRIIDNHFNVDDFEQFSFKSQKKHILESLKYDQNASHTQNVILSMLKQTQVILTKDFMLWNMDYVWKVLNGPLWYVGNLQIAFNTKFIKRLIQYLKPSRQFFSQLKWSISTIRHAQCACQLFRLLISTDDGCKNQYFQELIGELFECLKDQISANLKKRRPNLSHSPFSRSSIRYTLSRVYIILIGILSESERGIKFFAQHHMLAFLFPLTRKEITDHDMEKDRIVGPNDYLLRLLATNLDYAVSDDFRMLYPQWMSSGSYYLRKCLITHLELLYRAQMPKFDEWSINVLAVILKDKEQRLALTALKVLEKINLSQHSIKSTQYLIDLIHTQPTDSIIGVYGQFLFIKMLSTKQGLKFLQSTNWLNLKRKEWSSSFHTRYTNMLETALVHSVSTSTGNNNTSTIVNNDNNDNDEKDKDIKEKEIKIKKEVIDDEWLPYHLIHENRSDEEELYHEYLTQFPWSMSITIIRASGQETEVSTDCFFDYNCFYYKDYKNKNPISLGPGIHAIILDKGGCSKPLHIDKNSRIKIRLNIGHETLDDLYNKKSLSITVSMIEATEYKTCSIIHEDQSYFFFEGKEKQHLTRVFWSLSEIQKSHSLVRPLPHFYGELAKTDSGCKYIVNNIEFSDDLASFIYIVHNAYLSMNIVECEISDHNNLSLRSCLWALGMIGSSKTGLNLLNNFKLLDINNNLIYIIDDICLLTKESPTLSIRGTCLYVLGLLSRTQFGMNQLSKFGFGFPADNLELDLGVAIPSDINSFFKLGKCNYIKSDYLNNIEISCYSPPNLCRPANMKPMDPNELLGKQGHTEQTVLAHISALCNNVTQKSSASALHRLRSKKPSVFSNPLLFRETLKLLNTYQFKLAAKRFILFQLFDQVIFNDDDNSMDLFNQSMDDAILSFKQIREWRYNHKQMQIDKKQKKHQKRLLKKKEKTTKILKKEEPPTPSYKPKQAPKSPFIVNKKQEKEKEKEKEEKKEEKKKQIEKERKIIIINNDNDNDNQQRTRSKSNNKKPPPRPWPPIKQHDNNNINNNNNNNNNNDNNNDTPNNVNKSNRVQRAVSKLNGNKIPPPNNLKKRGISVGYDHDLADSPTKQVLGPNPLQADQSITDPQYD